MEQDEELVKLLTQMDDLLHQLRNILTVRANDRWLKERKDYDKIIPSSGPADAR